MVKCIDHFDQINKRNYQKKSVFTKGENFTAGVCASEAKANGGGHETLRYGETEGTIWRCYFRNLPTYLLILIKPSFLDYYINRII